MTPQERYDVYDAGFQAYMDGKLLSACPYTAEHSHYNSRCAWRRGWWDAQDEFFEDKLLNQPADKNPLVVNILVQTNVEITL